MTTSLNQDLKIKLWSIASQIPFQGDHWIRIKHNAQINPEIIFGRKFSDYVLELGAGWGEVGIQLASENPDIGYILVEKKKDRLKKIDTSIRSLGLQNVKIMCLNFQWFFREIFWPESFGEIIVNFPDPWPKKRHTKHRTVDSDFLESANDLLKKNGKFRFATDHGPYARKVIAAFRRSNHWKDVAPEFSWSRPNFPVSHFENLTKGEGKSIYYIERIKAE